MFIVNNLFASTRHCTSPLTNYVGLRWRTRPRKPFWLGLAKTKMFTIPEMKVDPPEQSAELQRLDQMYERQMKALKNFIMTNISLQLDREREIDTSKAVSEAKLLHERWNAESSAFRAKRLKSQEDEIAEAILIKVMQNNEKMKQIEAKVEEIVKKEIGLSETYITQDNLDEAIDKCLISVSEYNYAMDLSGNVYKGESMKPLNASSGMGEMGQKNIRLKEKEITKI